MKAELNETRSNPASATETKMGLEKLTKLTDQKGHSPCENRGRAGGPRNRVLTLIMSQMS